jgi:hypothetical protein
LVFSSGSSSAMRKDRSCNCILSTYRGVAEHLANFPTLR